MNSNFKTLNRSLIAAAFGATLLSMPAFADGDVGEHVETYWQHMEEYSADVDRMDRTLGELVVEAKKGEFDENDVDHLIEVWEEVKVHGAIEVVVTPLYPAIREGINAVRRAAAGEASPEVVEAAAKQTSTALHEGLGALRFATYQYETGERR